MLTVSLLQNDYSYNNVLQRYVFNTDAFLDEQILCETNSFRKKKTKRQIINITVKRPAIIILFSLLTWICNWVLSVHKQ